MCGFVGIVDVQSKLSGEELSNLMFEMAQPIRERGPDDSGIWVDPNVGVGISHRRLSVLDLTSAGKQPMLSLSGRFVLAFNGEIYNHLALREEIEAVQGNFKWRGNSDTETLLAGIDIWGLEKTLIKSVGMFAIALWDRQLECLFLARDRIGEKPLYYGWIDSALVFGSQIKAFRAHPAWHGEIDRDSLSLFFRHSCVPAPHSIFKNIRKLFPGSILSVSLRDVQLHNFGNLRRYWAIGDVANSCRNFPFLGDEIEAKAELKRLLEKSVSLQQIADVPLGSFLSGGIDSTAITALMQSNSTSPVRTFTVGFSEQGYDEARFALAIARHLRTEHTELYVSPEQAQSVIPSLPNIYDEPFSDPSQIPTLLIAGMARRHVTVSLSGDGGDELFGGYNRYFLGRGLRKKIGRVPLYLRAPMKTLLNRLPPVFINAFFSSLGYLFPPLKVAQPSDKVYKALEVINIAREVDVYRRLVSHWDDPTHLVIGSCEPETLLDKLIDEKNDCDSIEQWMMMADMQTYLPDDILVKLDRASMAMSLETRAPFLDHRLIEFSLSLPLSMKIRDGRGKWILQQMVQDYVPRALTERPKSGFAIPLDIWLRGPLKDWAEDLLNESKVRQEGFLNSDSIRSKWKEHLNGTRNWQYHLWDVLMFQSWLAAELS